jgi:hypothetical protein
MEDLRNKIGAVALDESVKAALLEDRKKRPEEMDLPLDCLGLFLLMANPKKCSLEESMVVNKAVDKEVGKAGKDEGLKVVRLRLDILNGTY